MSTIPVVDNPMPGMTGLELIRELAQTTAEGERPQIIMITAHASVESAIEAMRHGAFDYLQKPFEVDELIVVVRRALAHAALRSQHHYLLHERDEDSPLRHRRAQPPGAGLSGRQNSWPPRRAPC